jgi:malate dehydrogenase
MTRLDHNRAKAQLATKTGVQVAAVTNMTIWGNHSATQYPDVYNARVDGKPASDLVEPAWIEGEFIPTVQQRGAAVLEARGASSAASAASAALDHVRDWSLGSPNGDWVSMAVCSDGSYGVPEGLISGFPCTTANGAWKIVPGLDVNDLSRGRIDASVAELREERDAVGELGLI